MTGFDAAHMERFLAHYARIKDADQPEAWKVATAERFAGNEAMTFLIEPTRSVLPSYPFEPADYTEDGKKPLRTGL